MAVEENTHQAGDPQGTSRPAEPRGAGVISPGARSLEECRTGPYLIGRLVGLACHLAVRHPGASSERYADKIARGALPPVPQVIANLERMLARDLARPGTPAAYRAAADDIAGRLGELGTWPPAPWPLASPAASEFVLGQHHQSKALTDTLARRKNDR
jgi:hypothetical protein